MQGYNAWGGSAFEVADSVTDDESRGRPDPDVDRASLQRLEDQATQQSWLLGPSEQAKKRKEYVDFGCMICSKKVLKYTGLALLVSIVIIVIVVLIVKLVPHHHPPPPPEDNYTQALHKVLRFFDAQKSGVLPKSNNVSWRGNSAVRDGQPNADLSGGYYDAGDNIKFGFPGAFAMTVLSWSVIEYGPKYKAMGELSHIQEIIKWGTDYILKTFNKTADSINQVYAQVGIGYTGGESAGVNNDHSCWERPEDMDYERPALSCSACSDLAAEMAAALAAASIVFKDNRQYRQELVHAAEVVYRFARGPRGRYSEAVTDAKYFYNSTSYWDEYVWSSAWMYYATGNTSYISLATSLTLAQHAHSIDNSLNNRVFNWDNKIPGAQLILTRFRIMMNPGYPYEDVLRIYNNQTNLNMCAYLPQFKSFNVTKGGLVWFVHGQPQPLQYNAASAFLAALYADYQTEIGAPGWTCGPTFLKSTELRNFARSQIDYILGKNPNSMSYVVGFGDRYPLRVHHRAASIPSNVNSKGCTPGFKYLQTSSPNPHVLVGAMVGGPDAQDRFSDVRSNYNFTEPTITGASLLAAALVSLSGGDTGTIDTNTLFSALPPLSPPSPPPPAPWKP